MRVLIIALVAAALGSGRNFAFVQPVFSPDPHVLGALAEVLGEDRDTLAGWLNQATADRGRMMRKR